MQAALVMIRSDGERRSFSISRDIVVIGRREDCDLRIPLGDVSRKHCRLVRDGDELRLEDLGSSNGTYLNGQRVQEAPLQAGDTVQVGPVAFVLQIDGQPAVDEMNPILAAPAVAAAADSDEDLVGSRSSTHARAGGQEDVAELEEFEAMPESEALGEDAGFDIIAGDDDNPPPPADDSGAPIDADSENRR